MPRRPKNISPEDRQATVDLSRNIAAVVSKLLRSRGISQSRLAEMMGYTRSSMSQMLNPADITRAWRLKALVALSRALETPLSQIIMMAEAWSDDQVDEDAIKLSVVMIGTEPQSPERLQQIINEVSPGLQGEDVSLFEIGAPAFYDAYVTGDLTDLEAFDVLKRVSENRGISSTGKELPLWASVARGYIPQF